VPNFFSISECLSEKFSKFILESFRKKYSKLFLNKSYEKFFSRKRLPDYFVKKTCRSFSRNLLQNISGKNSRNLFRNFPSKNTRNFFKIKLMKFFSKKREVPDYVPKFFLKFISKCFR
jgi:hypothetical protein